MNWSEWESEKHNTMQCLAGDGDVRIFCFAKKYQNMLFQLVKHFSHEIKGSIAQLTRLAEEWNLQTPYQNWLRKKKKLIPSRIFASLDLTWNFTLMPICDAVSISNSQFAFFLLLCSAVRRRLINVDMSRNEMKLMQSSGDYAIWVPHSTTFQLIRISIELSSLKFTLGWPGDKQGNSKCAKSQKIKQFHRYRRRVILHKQVNSKRINERNESKHVLWIFANTRTPFF